MNPFLFAIVVHTLFSFHPTQPPINYLQIDTTINHLLDGKLNEWPAQKFETDPATQFKYAFDNDKQNLYLVLSIASFREQMKVMHQGMDLYLDLKDKKKEGKGIEFPVKREQSAADMLMNYRSQGNENAEQESPEQRKAAMRAMRAEMALGLSSMKVFGFSEDKSEEQGLIMPGSANIAFAWDSTDAMNIEYKIPLSFFGGASSLDQKDISLGWKVAAVQFSSHHSGSDEGSGGGGRHGGGGGGYGGHGGHGGGGYGGHGGGNSQQSGESMM
ncbi:MAG TPA: hypothetical protein VH815_13900, partial [Acidobacteriota bacterium]